MLGGTARQRVQRKGNEVLYSIIPARREKVLFELIREALAEQGKGLVHLVFHGLNRDIERPGDFPVREVVISAQNEDRPASFREDGKAFLQLVCGQRAVVGVRGVVRETDKDVFCEVRRPSRSFLLSGIVQSEIPGDPVEVDPGPKVRTDPLSRLPETNKCLLRQVLGGLAIPGVSIEEAEDFRVELLEEPLERGATAKIDLSDNPGYIFLGESQWCVGGDEGRGSVLKTNMHAKAKGVHHAAGEPCKARNCRNICLF